MMACSLRQLHVLIVSNLRYETKKNLENDIIGRKFSSRLHTQVGFSLFLLLFLTSLAVYYCTIVYESTDDITEQVVPPRSSSSRRLLLLRLFIS